MKLVFIAVFTITFAAVAWAAPSTTRFESFAGSKDNLSSLTGGLRSGTPITLTGDNQKVTFTSPTRPMGYGNVTRSLDLAQRQLAAQGINNPTPSQLQAALMGGTITNSKGTVTYAGVLQLRSSGMGWGQVAHTIGVHPGMGKSTSKSNATASSGTGITTAAGRSASSSGKSSISHAAGGNAGGQGSGHGLATSSAVTTAAGAGGMGSAGGGHGNAFGRGK